MSTCTAWVRFADGTISATLYDGMIEILVSQLYETPEQAWAAWQSSTRKFVNRFNHLVRRRWRTDSELHEPVVIWSTYGDGFWWEGTASRSVVAHEACEPYASGRELHDGEPPWANELPARPSVTGDP